MKHITYHIGSVAMLLLLLVPATGNAQQTTDQAALLAQIEQLLQQVAALQEQLGQTRAEVRALIRENVVEGMEGDDIRAIQELLASDATLYPSGLTTGFFGQLTREALQRFQARYDLEATGRLDEPTRAALEALKEDRVAGKMTPGYLASQAARERVKVRLRAKWGECDFANGFNPSTCVRKDSNYEKAVDEKEKVERPQRESAAAEALKRPLPTTAAERARLAREQAMKRAAEARARALAERDQAIKKAESAKERVGEDKKSDYTSADQDKKEEDKREVTEETDKKDEA